jgi:hypothetical protein
VAKLNHTVHDDGSSTFIGAVTDEERAQAYAELAARFTARAARAAATEVDPSEVPVGVESAGLTSQRAQATEIKENLT